MHYKEGDVYCYPCFADDNLDSLSIKSVVNLDYAEDRTYFETPDGKYAKIEICEGLNHPKIPEMLIHRAKMNFDDNEIDFVFYSQISFKPLDWKKQYYFYCSPIEDTKKFGSLNCSSTCRFFRLINPADLHARYA